ncbi:MAG TPA: 2Fe-2S iron-sulfur cluster-binding protein [Sphingobium sp.]|uniref:2Fe-2S iron-sulfur cluster-binding protein n=1 Tax=Sphingobium sp. TaxID=1912891 RepID=UPI002ED34769
MLQIFVKSREGAERSIDVPAGYTAMEAIRESGIDELLALCGGACSCATCHVYVDESFADVVPAMSEDENDLLDGSSHRKENSRLSCQLRLFENLQGLRIEIAPED